MSGCFALFYKEILRFWKVAIQTIGAPVLTALLYMLIFGQVFSGRIEVYSGVGYLDFLIPGLVMMSMLQNAISNSSSSLIQSKVMGSLVFILLSPLSYMAWFVAYVGASMVRALAVGLGVLLATMWVDSIGFAHPLWILVFALLGSATMGALGMIAGLWAEKFDQLAAFQNFVIVPLTFLAGTFYSIHHLPEFWQKLSYFNPFFYMIDGFRYGFLGSSDVSPWLSLGVASACFGLVTLITLYLLKTGYRTRNQ